jgi:hypothetical protein
LQSERDGSGKALGSEATEFNGVWAVVATRLRPLTGIFGFSRISAARLADHQLRLKNQRSDWGNSLLDPLEQELCCRLTELARGVVDGR